VKRHKILYLDEGRRAVLSGTVKSNDGEEWESLVDALDNLSTTGWEIALPVYGPVTVPGVPGQEPDAFIVVNDAYDDSKERQRRVEYLDGLISAAESRLQHMSGETDRGLLEMRIRELRASRKELIAEGAAS